jgi:hypothetical protein
VSTISLLFFVLRDVTLGKFDDLLFVGGSWMNADCFVWGCCSVVCVMREFTADLSTPQLINVIVPFIRTPTGLEYF